MPVYTYRCENCGVQFEKFQKFSDVPLVRCPECGKKTLRKVYTPVGIVFKGSGFYATDNRSPSGQRSMKEHASEERSKIKSEESGSTKSEEGSSSKGEESGSSKSVEKPAASSSGESAPASSSDKSPSSK